ncbi:putative glycosyltransferase YkoT [bioreactor metagenome]|uniref:Putative glycosyltransferase YkoT n=1 Tax=bioreactor metagenome TaxID=1076179 RepID=A0A645G8T8_9ZZZZ
MIGFKYAIVYYERKERFAGQTKYSFGRMCSLALDAITSFTYRPIQFISVLIILSLIMVIVGVICIIVQNTQKGFSADWLKIFTALWSISTLQLIAIRIIGDYVGRTYRETKKRPRYFIDVDLTKEE